jgi:C1A family cysteine protease
MSDLQPRQQSHYGWIPDLPDNRDHLFALRPETVAALPAAVDMRQQCPAQVYDQGRIGSCTANAIAGAFEFDLLKQQLTDFMPSRLFIYYNERLMEGTVGSDSGAMIRDGVKSVSKVGVCPETEWPYDDTHPSTPDGGWPAGARAGQKPTDRCYTDALGNRVMSYQRVVRSLPQLRGCLAEGFPFIFGFTVYESFESDAVASTGVAPMPGPGERVLGGHAVLAVGYDDADQRFLVRNSWGTKWGNGGYFTMPYAYLTERNLSSDFWTLRTVA